MATSNFQTNNVYNHEEIFSVLALNFVVKRLNISSSNEKSKASSTLSKMLAKLQKVTELFQVLTMS